MQEELKAGNQGALFGAEELVQLVRSSGRRALEAIDAGNPERVREICKGAKNEHLIMQAGYLSWNTKTLTYVYKNLGLEALRQILTHGIKAWLRPMVDQFANGVTREAVSTLAQFVRTDCAGEVSVEEDEDRIVFRLDGWSNQRLVERGEYDPKVSAYPLTVVHEADALTGCQPDVQILLTVMRTAERMMIEWLGYPAFVLDTHADGVDRLVVFKNPATIDAHFFERVGETRSADRLSVGRSVAGGKLFSDAERAALGKTWLERAVLTLEEGNPELAKGFCALGETEWDGGHHLGRDWIAGQLSYLIRNHPDILSEYFDEVYERGTLEGFFAHARQMDTVGSVQFIANVLRQHTMTFSLREDADKFVFASAPCGSGGRLLAERAYDADSPKGFARVPKGNSATFQLDNFPVYCMHCSVSNRAILEHGGPYMNLVDPDIRDGELKGRCTFNIYKSGEAVPDRLYDLAGLPRPVRKVIPIVPT